MTIKSGIGTGVIPAIVGDTTILAVSDRVSISASSCHNTSLTESVTLTFFISPNLTSGSGKEVDIVSLAPGEDQDVGGIIGQGYTQNIIVNADKVDVNVTTTYTQYSGADI